jgi:hypothetical protein
MVEGNCSAGGARLFGPAIQQRHCPLLYIKMFCTFLTVLYAPIFGPGDRTQAGSTLIKRMNQSCSSAVSPRCPVQPSFKTTSQFGASNYSHNFRMTARYSWSAFQLQDVAVSNQVVSRNQTESRHYWSGGIDIAKWLSSDCLDLGSVSTPSANGPAPSSHGGGPDHDFCALLIAFYFCTAQEALGLP